MRIVLMTAAPVGRSKGSSMSEKPMTIQEEHAENIRECLGDFMHDIEEWESTIAGTPTEKELEKLDDIYEVWTMTLDKLYGYKR